MDPINLETDTIQLCQIIRCLSEEWGSEPAEIQMPAAWHKCAQQHNFDPKHKFVTNDTLVLIFSCGQETFRREFRLSPSCIA